MLDTPRDTVFDNERRLEMKGMRAALRPAAVLSAAALTAGLAACSDEDADGAQDLTFWTPHTTPERVAVQERIAADFEEETGVSVNIVGMEAGDMNQAVVAGAASGELPDIALIGPDQVASWSSQGLLDPEPAQTVLETLDPSTVSERALDLVTVDGAAEAVPSDAWGELVYYRTDVFDELGLDAPESVQDVVEAASTIDDSDVGMAGIVLGTQPADPMARENLEHFGLANGCQMFEGDEVALESDACVQTLEDMQTMAEASVSGDQDVESTRAAYLAGGAAMVVWSPHMLNSIAGLDANFPVSAEGVEDNPLFLAENTGVVGGLTGAANDEPTGYGLTMNYGVLQGADTEAARQYIEYVMTDGYIDTLASAPDGRAPVRSGTAENPQEYADAWAELEIGPDGGDRLPFTEAYSDDELEEIIAAANDFSLWGFGTDNWATAGAAMTQNTLVTDYNALLNDGDPQGYAEDIADSVRTLQLENE